MVTSARRQAPQHIERTRVPWSLADWAKAAGFPGSLLCVKLRHPQVTLRHRSRPCRRRITHVPRRNPSICTKRSSHRWSCWSRHFCTVACGWRCCGTCSFRCGWAGLRPASVASPVFSCYVLTFPCQELVKRYQHLQLCQRSPWDFHQV